MKYIKDRYTLLNENLETDLFDLVFECITSTYTDLNEFYNVLNSFNNRTHSTKDLFANLIYDCIPNEYIKRLGSIFIDRYIFGNDRIELVRYLVGKFEGRIGEWIFTNMDAL